MKRSLFKKPAPAWSKSQAVEAKDDGNGEDLFRRSDRTYADIVAEKQRRKAEKKAREERERRDTEDEEKARVKRRKTSESAEEAEGNEGRELSVTRGVQAGGDEVEGSPRSESRRSIFESKELRATSATAPTSKEPTANNIIDLEDEDLEIVAVKAPEPVPVEDEDEDSEEDEQFRELARKARERARLQKLGLYNPSPTSTPETNSQFRSPTNEYGPASGPSQSPPRPPTPDPILHIYITSPIDNTNPLIVQRKLSQPLREVRKAYCDRQKFTPEFRETTFLVWKGVRLFDVTSCKSLGIHVDSDGTISDSSGALNSMDQSITMELMTPELLEAYRRHKARHRSTGLEEEEEESQQAASKEPAEPELKLTLKSRGFEEMKLAVKPSTTVSRMISVFRTQRNVGEDKEIAFVFDGDRLNPDSTAADNGIDDMDTIDIHIK